MESFLRSYSVAVPIGCQIISLVIEAESRFAFWQEGLPIFRSLRSSLIAIRLHPPRQKLPRSPAMAWVIHHEGKGWHYVIFAGVQRSQIEGRFLPVTVNSFRSGENAIVSQFPSFESQFPIITQYNIPVIFL